MLALTNDGLTGFRRVGRQRRHPSRARSRRLASRRRPTAAGRTASSCARASATRPARSCGRRTSAARSSARSTCAARRWALYFAASSGRGRCLAAPKKPCDLSKGIVTDAGLEHRHVPPHRPRPRLPLQARAPRGVRRARRDAAPPARLRCPPTGPYEIASFDPEARDPARPQPEVSRVVAGGAAERLPGRDRRALRRLAGRARRRGPPRRGRSGRRMLDAAVAGRARVRPDAAREPARAQPVGRHLVPRAQHASPALRRRAGAPGAELRRRPRAAARPHRRPGPRPGDLPGPASGLRRLPALLPLHGRAERRRSLDRPRPGACAATRATPRAPPARPSRSGSRRVPHFSTAAGRYVVSVLDSLGYKARLRVADDPFLHGGQAPPPARLQRLVPGLRRDAGRLHPPGAHLRAVQPR